MKKYILTTIAIIYAHIIFAQQPQSDTAKYEHVDSIQLVIHPNDFRMMIQDLNALIDSKAATKAIIDFLNRSTRKYEALKPKQAAKPNKEQPK